MRRLVALLVSVVAVAGACNAVLGVDDLVVVAPDGGATTTTTTGAGGSDCGAGCAAEACCAGVCVELATDPAHCGSCDNACKGTTCVAGGCTTECTPPSFDCNDSLADGCEVDVDTDPAHCGSCTESCAPGSTCAGGACVCPPMQGDCDADPDHVCEIDLSSDESHCGDCTTVCAANETCTAGECTCTPGFLDCVATPGCESSASDPATCGDCITTCDGTQVCNAGTCADACDPGLTLCTASCVDLQNDPSHCGNCDTPVGPNQTCVGGMATCDPGWDDCSAAPGCETATTSDPQHCGKCAIVCKPGALCVMSGCQCSLSTPLDCGAACQECCNNADCAPGNVCSGGTCISGCLGAPLESWGENVADAHKNVTTDTHIRGNEPNHNFGKTSYVRADGLDTPAVGLFRFDLAALPATAYVCSATLRLFNDGNDSPNTFTLHRVLEAWAEGNDNGTAGEANWNKRQMGLDWTLDGCGAPASCDASSVGSVVLSGVQGTQYDITIDPTLVQGWVNGSIGNYGIALKNTMGIQGANVRSREGQDGQRPSLRITFFVP